MSQHWIERRGARLAYTVRGSGPPVVLLQGLGLAGGMWLQLPGGLLRSGYTVVVPDARGTGASAVPRPPYTMAQLADDVAAIIEQVGRGPALVVGLSMGGMTAQHLALRHPRLVRGLVLAATTCGLPYGKLPNLALLPAIRRSMRGEPGAAEQMRLLLVHPDSLERNPRLFDAWDRQMARTPLSARGLLGQLCAVGLHSTGRKLDRLRCPTVVITGESDRVVPPENSRILARRIPGAELVLLPQAGHAFPLEQPAALPEAIKQVHRSAV